MRSFRLKLISLLTATLCHYFRLTIYYSSYAHKPAGQAGLFIVACRGLLGLFRPILYKGRGASAAPASVAFCKLGEAFVAPRSALPPLGNSFAPTLGTAGMAVTAARSWLALCDGRKGGTDIAGAPPSPALSLPSLASTGASALRGPSDFVCAGGRSLASAPADAALLAGLPGVAKPMPKPALHDISFNLQILPAMAPAALLGVRPCLGAADLHGLARLDLPVVGALADTAFLAVAGGSVFTGCPLCLATGLGVSGTCTQQSVGLAIDQATAVVTPTFLLPASGVSNSSLTSNSTSSDPLLPALLYSEALSSFSSPVLLLASTPLSSSQLSDSELDKTCIFRFLWCRKSALLVDKARYEVALKNTHLVHDLSSASSSSTVAASSTV